jgi:hypothetical protein
MTEEKQWDVPVMITGVRAKTQDEAEAAVSQYLSYIPWSIFPHEEEIDVKIGRSRE